MGVAAKTGIKAIRLANGALDTAVLAIVLLLIAIGCYAMWDSKQLFDAATAEKFAVYKPGAEEDSPSFEQLRAMNPEVFAWLTVYGTNIDYPVVHSPDESQKYVSADALGRYSLSGSIFLGSEHSPGFADFSSILYGHHMEKQAMFGEIGLFVEKSYFDARQYGMLYFGGRAHGLEFFAFLHTDAYDGTIYRAGINGREERGAYLDLLLARSIHTRGVPVTADDKIVLLSTCSGASTNGRDILVGKITDEPREDPFETEKPDNAMALAVDRLPGLWARSPRWVKISLICLPLFILLLLLSLIIRNTRQKNNNKQKNEQKRTNRKQTKKLPDKGGT
ncbi:MAG: class B sortase [Oscillospiraceae bacterium]|nr:class B sortase [Oscillospiraceae bacterium]